MRLFFPVTLALLLCIQSAPLSASAHDDGLFKHIADAYAAGRNGIVTYRVTTITTISGGPIHQRIEETAAYAVAEGEPIARRYLTHVENGKPAGLDDLKKRADTAPGPLAREQLMLPYISAAVADYQLTATSELAGITTAQFKSSVCDASHGDGMISVDEQLRVINVVFKPCTLPARANSGSVTIRLGAVAPDVWDVTTIVRSFTGRALFVKGRADATSTYSGYRRERSESDARATLAAAS